MKVTKMQHHVNAKCHNQTLNMIIGKQPCQLIDVHVQKYNSSRVVLFIHKVITVFRCNTCNFNANLMQGVNNRQSSFVSCV